MTARHITLSIDQWPCTWDLTNIPELIQENFLACSTRVKTQTLNAYMKGS